MSWAFIVFNNKKLKVKVVGRYLKENKIVFTTKKITQPKKLSGLCMPKNEVKKMLGLLQLDEDFLSHSQIYNTDLDKVQYYELSDNIKSFFEDRLLGAIAGISFDKERKVKLSDLPDPGMLAYVDAAFSRFKKEIKESKTSVKNLESKMEELCKQLYELSRQAKLEDKTFSDVQKEAEVKSKLGKLASAYKELAEFQKAGGKIDEIEKIYREKLAEEYQRFMRHSYVKRVDVTDDAVIVYTRMLVLRGCDIGEYKVYMHFNGKLGCENLTSRPEKFAFKFDHPHIVNIYKYCFGPSGKIIRELIKDKEFYLAFNKTWTRLNQYNSADDAAMEPWRF